MPKLLMEGNHKASSLQDFTENAIVLWQWKASITEKILKTAKELNRI